MLKALFLTTIHILYVCTAAASDQQTQVQTLEELRRQILEQNFSSVYPHPPDGVQSHSSLLTFSALEPTVWTQVGQTTKHARDFNLTPLLNTEIDAILDSADKALLFIRNHQAFKHDSNGHYMPLDQIKDCLKRNNLVILNENGVEKKYSLNSKQEFLAPLAIFSQQIPHQTIQDLIGRLRNSQAILGTAFHSAFLEHCKLVAFLSGLISGTDQIQNAFKSEEIDDIPLHALLKIRESYLDKITTDPGFRTDAHETNYVRSLLMALRQKVTLKPQQRTNAAIEANREALSQFIQSINLGGSGAQAGDSQQQAQALERLNAQIQEQQQKLSEQAQQFALQAEQFALQEEQLENLRAEKLVLENQSIQLNVQLSELQSQLRARSLPKDVAQEARATEVSTEQIQTLSIENNQLKEEIERLKAQVSESDFLHDERLQKILSEKEKLTTMLKSTKTELVNSQKEITFLKTANELKAASDRITTTQTTETSVRRSFEQSLTEVSLMTAQLQTTLQTLEEITPQPVDLGQPEVPSLPADPSQLVDRALQRSPSFVDAYETLEHLKHDHFSEVRSALDNLKRLLNKMVAVKETLGANVQSFNNLCCVLTQRHSKLLQENAVLQNQVQELVNIEDKCLKGELLNCMQRSLTQSGVDTTNLQRFIDSLDQHCRINLTNVSQTTFEQFFNFTSSIVHHVFQIGVVPSDKRTICSNLLEKYNLLKKIVLLIKEAIKAHHRTVPAELLSTITEITDVVVEHTDTISKDTFTEIEAVEAAVLPPEVHYHPPESFAVISPDIFKKKRLLSINFNAEDAKYFMKMCIGLQIALEGSAHPNNKSYRTSLFSDFSELKKLTEDGHLATEQMRACVQARVDKFCDYYIKVITGIQKLIEINADPLLLRGAFDVIYRVRNYFAKHIEKLGGPLQITLRLTNQVYPFPPFWDQLQQQFIQDAQRSDDSNPSQRRGP